MMLSSHVLPERNEVAMREFFPEWSLRFVPLPDGRVMMTVHDQDANIDLEPPSIPDGFYKMLTILVALESKPDLLLIDEFENSLHVRLMEHLLDAIRSAETTTILTTHSPLRNFTQADPPDFTKLTPLISAKLTPSISNH